MLGRHHPGTWGVCVVLVGAAAGCSFLYQPVEPGAPDASAALDAGGARRDAGGGPDAGFPDDDAGPGDAQRLWDAAGPGPDAGLDAGADGGALDAGADGGAIDAGLDAGGHAPDAGADAGPDAGADAGPGCGNTILDPGEQCDDGDADPDDGCDQCQWVEVEPNDNLLAATPLPLGEPVRASLAAGDQDYFRFSVVTGRAYRIEVFRDELGLCPDSPDDADLEMALYQEGPTYAPYALDDDQVQDRFGACPYFQWTETGASGERVVRLYDRAFDDEIPLYFVRVTELVVEWPYGLPNFCGTPGEVCDDENITVADGCHQCTEAEIEPNNMVADATPLSVGVPTFYGVAAVTGIDYFTFEAAFGRTYRLEVFRGDVGHCAPDDDPDYVIDVYNGLNLPVLLESSSADAYPELGGCGGVQWNEDAGGTRRVGLRQLNPGAGGAALVLLTDLGDPDG